MAKSTLIVLNPFDEKQLELIKEYETENDLEEKLSNQIVNVRKKYNKSDYERLMLKSNEMELTLLLIEDNKLQECAMLKIYKDIKSSYLNLSPSKKETRTRNMIHLATKYTFNMGMEEVFTTINSYEKVTEGLLEEEGYVNLGQENEVISFVKSTDKIIESQNKKEEAK